MYGCESWTIKRGECQRIDAFELWHWRRLLRVPWTARRSNSSQRKSVLNIHWKDWCWSWNSNTLATWCKELTHLKRPWCWEILKVGREGDNRGWDGWMASQTWVWVNSGSWWWTGRPSMLQSMGSQRVRYDWVNELNWTDGLSQKETGGVPWESCLTWGWLTRSWGQKSQNPFWLLTHGLTNSTIEKSSSFLPSPDSL